MIQQEKPLQQLKPSLLIQQAVGHLRTQLIPVLRGCPLPLKMGLLGVGLQPKASRRV